MKPHSEASMKKWADGYRQWKAGGRARVMPSETLVRLLLGSYLDGLPKDLKGQKILDVGFGDGINTKFFASFGMKVSGVEVHPDICAMVLEDLVQEGILDCDLQVGTNVNLPFEDNTFDWLVSWNVIHYTDNETDIAASVAEYARVLKPGGRVLVSTTGPEHLILKDAISEGEYLHRIVHDELRKDQVFYYFGTEENLRSKFEPGFSDIKIARLRDNLFDNQMQDFFLLTGGKGPEKKPL